MKVKDLIEQLGYMDQDAEVHFAYGYGDHWRTTVAPKVSQVFEGAVQYSDYHRMDKLADEDFEDEEPGNPDENVRRVVIIE
jgi:hypothetical protein